MEAEAIRRLRADLAARVRDLHRAEVDAFAALATAVEEFTG
jgi:hypothetical protein